MNATTELKLGVALALVTGLAGCDWSARPQRVEAGGFRDLDAQVDRFAASRVAVAPPPVLATSSGHQPDKASSSSSAAGADGGRDRSVDVDADLQIKRLVIAHGVEGREPVRPAKTFTKGQQDRIYAFVEVGNQDRAQSEIFVSFVRKGTAEAGRIRLSVGASPRWRTWAYTRLARDEGQWVAIVRNARGEELARKEFEVSGAGDSTPAQPDNAV